MRLKSILQTANVYSKRIAYRKRNSAPFLSGDLFAQNADFVFQGQKKGLSNNDFNHAKEARVIFVLSHEYEIFLENLGRHVRPSVVLLGNSDRDFDHFNLEILPRVKQMFIQNLNTSNCLTQALPIGIENLSLGTNGIPSLFKQKYVTNPKANLLLIGPLSPTHNERMELLSLEGQIDPRLTYLQSRLNPKAYAAIASYYRLVAAPRGNGLDTHRFWETLYRGGVPVVKTSNWSKSMRNLGLPIAEVQSWVLEELNKVLNVSLNIEDPKKYPPLWWPFWKSRINDYC